jgi:hypothetical protein
LLLELVPALELVKLLVLVLALVMLGVVMWEVRMVLECLLPAIPAIPPRFEPLSRSFPPQEQCYQLATALPQGNQPQKTPHPYQPYPIPPPKPTRLAPPDHRVA